jgi:hypothetical protein
MINACQNDGPTRERNPFVSCQSNLQFAPQISALMRESFSFLATGNISEQDHHPFHPQNPWDSTQPLGLTAKTQVP